MLNIINTRYRQEIARRKLEEQPGLLKSNWIDFNQFRIAYKNIPNDAWHDDSKNFSGLINTNADNLID